MIFYLDVFMLHNMSLQKNKDAWPLVEFYVDCHNVDGNHIRAYDEFIERAKNMLETTITHENVTVRLTNLHLVAPYHIVEGQKIDIYPSECVRNKETYCSDMFCDIEYIKTVDDCDEYVATNDEMVYELVKYLLPDLKKTKKIRNDILEIVDDWNDLQMSHFKQILKIVEKV